MRGALARSLSLRGCWFRLCRSRLLEFVLHQLLEALSVASVGFFDALSKADTSFLVAWFNTPRSSFSFASCGSSFFSRRQPIHLQHVRWWQSR